MWVWDTEVEAMSVTAKEKFIIGQRVRLTERGVAANLQGKHDRRFEVIKSFPRRSAYTEQDITILVNIHRDGDYHKTTRAYHMDFWEPVSQ